MKSYSLSIFVTLTFLGCRAATDSSTNNVTQWQNKNPAIINTEVAEYTAKERSADGSVSHCWYKKDNGQTTWARVNVHPYFKNSYPSTTQRTEAQSGEWDEIDNMGGKATCFGMLPADKGKMIAALKDGGASDSYWVSNSNNTGACWENVMAYIASEPQDKVAKNVSCPETPSDE